MPKFSEYIKNDVKKENFAGVDNAELNDAINKYSDYSEQELINEFLSETNKKKQSGELNDEKIEKMKETLLPYLNDKQKTKLNQIINMVK